MQTLSRATVRMLDRLAIERFAVPGLILMENAGAACAGEIMRRLGHDAWRPPVVVLAGTGNNGGDGFVVARHLWNAGVPVSIHLVGTADRLRPGSDAAINWEAARATGVPAVGALPEGCGCCVDALFGTGLDRPLGEPYQRLFERIEGTAKPVLAVDIPSGLDADTGAVLGAALHAAVTVTFAAAKPGHRTGRGPELCGEVLVAPISIPRRLLEFASRDEEAFRQWGDAVLAGSAPPAGMPFA
jgi:NAD(P)H-hydrate epimerase